VGGPARRPPLAAPDRRVDRDGAAEVATDGVRLVLLQREQRRDHDARAVDHGARELVDRRLAEAGRHHGQHVPARHERLDRLALPRPERLEAQLVDGGP